MGISINEFSPHLCLHIHYYEKRCTCGRREGFSRDKAWEIEDGNGNIKVIKILLYRRSYFLWRSRSDTTESINSSISCRPYVRELIIVAATDTKRGMNVARYLNLCRISCLLLAFVISETRESFVARCQN